MTLSLKNVRPPVISRQMARELNRPGRNCGRKYAGTESSCR
ncbi:MAG: hypothetical protein ACPLRU_07890 [Desulfofundulus sp.]